MSFEPLNLDPRILEALAASGYTQPTPIQTAAIPLILSGGDLMASAQTGSGKTAAFMLPALHKLASPSPIGGRGPRVLVLTPTRELATQIKTAATTYGAKLPKIRVGSILGGMPYPLQNKMLSSTLDILIATPGRLLDHIGRGRIDFSRLEILVIDEADRMLDMGFIDDVAEIGRALPATRQTLLFSATFEGPIANLAQSILRDPQRIAIDGGVKTRHENIEQRLLYTDDMSHKDRLLDHLLRDIAVNQALVFTSTKSHADDLAGRLSIGGFDVAALHGDMSQRERNRTLTSMRDGHIRVLVATDVAARGLDVQGITHVINYDLPRQAEDYVHRIGRTGRAGRQGIAISFAGGRDVGSVKQIERFTAQEIPVHTVVGLEPRYANSKSRKPSTGGGGGGGNVSPRVNRTTNAPRPSASRRSEAPGAGGSGAMGGSDGRDSASRRPRSPFSDRSQATATDGASRSRNGRVQRWGQPKDGQPGNSYQGNGNRNGAAGRGAQGGNGPSRTGNDWTPSDERPADPYDRQGDQFRAQLRQQEERMAKAPQRRPSASGYAKPGQRKGPQSASQAAGSQAFRPYREPDDYGVNKKPTKLPKITVLHKKVRGED